MAAPTFSTKPADFLAAFGHSAATPTPRRAFDAPRSMRAPTRDHAPPHAALLVSAAVGIAIAAGSGGLVLTKRARRSRPTVAAFASSSTSSSASTAASLTSSAAVPPSSALAPTVASASATPAPDAPTPLLTIGRGTRVLAFGDSMVDAGFSQELRKRIEARGGTLVTDGWTSSSTKTWAQGERLSRLLASARPDVVIITLGANEVFLPAPEQAAANVRSIVKKLGDRPCVWVGPPLWKGETGIVGVERRHSAPCGFFDSGALKLDRQPDGIHPNGKGGALWAEAVWNAFVRDAAATPDPVPGPSPSPSASASR
jgi:lysophospholipase L1-like esterase